LGGLDECGWVVVEDEVVVEPVVVVLLGVVVLVGVLVQDSLTVLTPPWTGSLIDDRGVPGGTFTVKFRVCPVTSVTVTTQLSAEADGIAAMPMTANAHAVAAAATLSFRLLNTVALFLPPSACARKRRRDHMATRRGSY
jgi:hypothetical protein